MESNRMGDNSKNTYNQNFSGVCCTCKKVVPFDRDGIGINLRYEMIQCVVCEDW